MDDVPLSIVGSLLSAAVVVGVGVGVLRSQVKALREDFRAYKIAAKERLDRHDAVLDEHNKALHEFTIELVKTHARVSDIAELKQIAVRGDVFAIRMSAQDEMLHAQDEILHELRLALDTKASRGEMPAAKALPPMRARQPSRPLGREDR